MKLLAILKDSFRETLDARVFTILLALSVGVMVLFASLSFTPKPNTDLRFTLQESLKHDGGVMWVIRGIQFVDGPVDHPATPLRLTISARHPTAAAAAEVRDDIPAARSHFERASAVSITGSCSASPTSSPSRLTIRS
jgi:hypothetical protein